ncbi:MAG TPA: MauE/DoxX family redox-associated membrane protein [Chthoniobacterales bacterium]|nr:MauE/DoxX family redox-associated membrane protein [Chthoniobacterales bacterium]
MRRISDYASSVSRVALALFFIITGTAHFISPTPYVAIVPSYVPWPGAIVALSGVAEILGGVGVCFSESRRASGWWLIALLLAVFPANIHAISTGMVVGGHPLPVWMLWGRLPIQLLFIAWVYSVCFSRERRPLP